MSGFFSSLVLAWQELCTMLVGAAQNNGWVVAIAVVCCLYAFVSIISNITRGVLNGSDRARGVGKFSPEAKRLRSREERRLGQRILDLSLQNEDISEKLGDSESKRKALEKRVRAAEERARVAEESERSMEARIRREEAGFVGLGIFGDSFGDPTPTGTLGIIDMAEEEGQASMGEPDGQDALAEAPTQAIPIIDEAHHVVKKAGRTTSS